MLYRCFYYNNYSIIKECCCKIEIKNEDETSTPSSCSLNVLLVSEMYFTFGILFQKIDDEKINIIFNFPTLFFKRKDAIYVFF